MANSGSVDSTASHDEPTAVVGEPVQHTPLSDGARLGRYLVVERAGAGAMGVVYRAYDTTLRREVALKLLRRRGDGTHSSEPARLLREAQAMASLSHPNVVPVYDAAEYDGALFMSMEFVDGRTLGAFVAQEDPPWPERLAKLCDAGRGLAAAHAQGIIHRDFKPGNVMVGDDGRVRVTDFGLATTGAAAPLHAEEHHPATDDVDTHTSGALTVAGAIMGTPTYLAPEQHQGEPASPASDQYAFCVAAFEVLSGKRPFEGKGLTELLHNKLNGEVPRMDRAIPARIQRALVRGLSVDPEARWPSMEALLAALEGKGSRSLAYTVGAVAVVGLAALGLSRSTDPCEHSGQIASPIWTEAEKTEAEAAFEATDIPLASQLWSQASGHVDQWVARANAEHRQVCEGAHRRNEYSAQVLDKMNACLMRHVEAAEPTIALLREADDDVVEHAIELTTNLPDTSSCLDADAVLAGVEPPDRKIAEQVDEIRRALDQTKTYARAGKLRETLEALQDLEPKAATVGYDPIHAKVLGGLALAGSELGMYEDAERNGRLGYFLALQAGDDETASNIATTMVHLVGDRMGRVDDGLLWADSAVALVERAHGGPTRRASAKYSRGSVLHTKGDFEAAIAEFEAALELLEGDESERALFLRGAIENNLGVVYFDQSDTTRALEHFEASNRYATQLYGEGHPQTALSLLNVGSVRSKSGDPEAGIEDIKRAGEIFEKAWGKNHPNTLAAHGNIGSTLMEMGRYDEALQEYEAALAGFDARQESPPQLTRLMTSAAMAYATVERFDEALQWIRRDITLLETRHAEPYLETANAYYALGNILNRQERYDESVEALEHARDLAARASSEDHPLAIQARHAIGTALLGAERYDEALPHLEAALVAAKGNGDLGEDVQARIRFHLGVALWSDPEQHVRAHELVQEARTRAGDDAKSEALRDEIDAWLRQHPAP